MKLNNGILFVLFLVFIGCSTKPQVVEHAGEFRGTGANPVYIAHHGWHTGIVVPAAAIQARLPTLEERFPETAYLEFGWGDKDFYQAKEMNSGLALRAVFWPTDTVVRAAAVPADLGRYFAATGIVKLCLEDEELDSLLDFLTSSFRISDQDELIASENGTGRGSQFYEGMGDYYLTNTCNTWTAKGLKSAGMELSTTFKATAGSIMAYLHDHENVETLRRLDEASDAPPRSAFSCQNAP